MKISVQKVDTSKEEELIIKCHDEESQWVKIAKQLRDGIAEVTGRKDDEIFKISVKDIYYFEAVENHTFIYTKDGVYESGLKVYEFEEISGKNEFFRASKSTVVNIRKIRSLKPLLSSKFELTLQNDLKIIVNRHYVQELKKLMGL